MSLDSLVSDSNKVCIKNNFSATDQFWDGAHAEKKYAPGQFHPLHNKMFDGSFDGFGEKEYPVKANEIPCTIGLLIRNEVF